MTEHGSMKVVGLAIVLVFVAVFSLTSGSAFHTWSPPHVAARASEQAWKTATAAKLVMHGDMNHDRAVMLAESRWAAWTWMWSGMWSIWTVMWSTHTLSGEGARPVVGPIMRWAGVVGTIMRWAGMVRAGVVRAIVRWAGVVGPIVWSTVRSAVVGAMMRVGRSMRTAIAVSRPTVFVVSMRPEVFVPPASEACLMFAPPAMVAVSTARMVLVRATVPAIAMVRMAAIPVAVVSVIIVPVAITPIVIVAEREQLIGGGLTVLAWRGRFV